MSVSEKEVRQQGFMLKAALIGWGVTLLGSLCLYYADMYWFLFHQHEIANVLGTTMIVLLALSAICMGALISAWAHPRKVLKVKVP